MSKNLDKWYRALAPRPVVLVSTVNSEGISNAAPFSFVMPVSSSPPLIAFASAPGHDTVKNVLLAKDFVVNVPGRDVLSKLWICKKDFPYGVSEIKESGLTEEKSKKVKSPGIRESLARFECKLHKQLEAGDHLLIIGEVVEAFIDESFFVDGKYQARKASPLLHVGGAEFSLPGEKIMAGSIFARKEE